MNTTTTTDGQPTVTWVLETKFKDLTDEEIGNIANEVFGEFNWSKRVLTFARAILRKAQEK
jgi:hypothetical protein